MPTPDYTSVKQARHALGAFATGQRTHVADAMPQAVLRLPDRNLFDALLAHLGPTVLAQAVDPNASVPSPLAHRSSGAWLRDSHSIGINLRTVGDLLGAVKYVLTLPPHVNAVHLLPVFEPGVVGSLYGMATWHINEEFFSAAWRDLMPWQRHVNDQLRAFVNICHGLGKVVGLDVIPHVDRFSEIALCNPWLFEWVRRSDTKILDQREDLHDEVQEVIYGWRFGRSSPGAMRRFFAQHEGTIARELFGDGGAWDRNRRRDELIQWLYTFGYETLPATMAPPYRGLELDPSPEAVTVDHRGRHWRDYRITQPQEMSRVFGPLTRYRLWEAKDDNRAWELDHARPRMPVWNYVADHYREVVEHYGFDFLRGDMSHVQTRPSGVPEHIDEPYDILRFVKRACAKTRPHFAYFAESFLTADDYMTYGSEAAHLDASEAEVALGNLQNYAPHEPAFHGLLHEYSVLSQKHAFAPAFTLFTADKDDPRFDANFATGNVARYFFAVFCPAFPVYNALGFHGRLPHRTPAPNEHYSKLYVFHYEDGPKATHGAYVFEENVGLWEACRRMDGFRQNMPAGFSESDVTWVLAPDVTGERQVLVWRAGGYRFAVNFGLEAAVIGATTGNKTSPGSAPLEPVFTQPRDAFDKSTQTLQPNAGIIAFDQA